MVCVNPLFYWGGFHFVPVVQKLDLQKVAPVTSIVIMIYLGASTVKRKKRTVTYSVPRMTIYAKAGTAHHLDLGQVFVHHVQTNFFLTTVKMMSSAR